MPYPRTNALDEIRFAGPTGKTAAKNPREESGYMETRGSGIDLFPNANGRGVDARRKRPDKAQDFVSFTLPLSIWITLENFFVFQH